VPITQFQVFAELWGVMNGIVSTLDCIKVIQAQSLLESTDIPIESIATRLGFMSVVEFERLFLRITRIKPGSLRNGNGANNSSRRQ